MKYWRNHRIRGWREYAAFLLLICVTATCSLFLAGATALTAPPQTLGITFSDKYAQQLGLNPTETFSALLDDLGVRNVRMPVYWSDVETAPGQYDFSRLDALLDVAESRGVSVTLAVGMKVPRWPECFIPSFYRAENPTFDAEVLHFVQAVVTHTRTMPVVTRWQVENEALFPYGECPDPSIDRLRDEVRLVRALDDRPIMLTVSGEQEPWLDLASLADVIGVSVYRFAYQDSLGAIAFPHTPWYYRVHAGITKLFVHDVVISELQMEPWFTGNPQDPDSIDVPFSAESFDQHIEFAQQTGAPEALLWGAEWWYYEHLQGNDDLWNAAIRAFMTK